MSWSGDDPRPLRPPRHLGRAGRRRALLLGPPRRRRRAGRQGRAARGRFRPALRRLRQRRERLFRLAQPRQGIRRARPQGRGRPGAPRRDAGAGRCVHPEPRPRRRRPPRLRARRPARAEPAPHHLLDLGLRRRGSLSRPQGLRSSGAGGDRPLHRHRQRARHGARRRVGVRHRRRHDRLPGHPAGADRPRPHRARGGMSRSRSTTRSPTG